MEIFMDSIYLIIIGGKKSKNKKSIMLKTGEEERGQVT